MLLEREGSAIESGWDGAAGADCQTFTPAPVAEPYARPASRYGEGRRFSPVAVAVTAAVHALIALALLGLGAQAVTKKRERLAVVQLSAAPPPATAPQPEPEPVQRQVTVQPPAIVLPVPVARPISVAIPMAPQIDVPRTIAPAAAPAPSATPAPPAPSSVNSSDLGTRMIAETRRAIRSKAGGARQGISPGADRGWTAGSRPFRWSEAAGTPGSTTPR